MGVLLKMGVSAGAESGTHFLSEERGLFPGGEMAAVGGFVEVVEVLVAALGPALGGAEDLAGEDADGDRHVDDAARVEVVGMVFPIDPRGRGPGLRQPVERDIVEDRIAAQHLFGLAVAVGPLRDLLIHPRRHAHRRVHQRIADGLGPRVHHRGIGGIVAVEGGELVESPALLGRQIGGAASPAARIWAISAGTTAGMLR
jgi:hypothetical protein